MGRGCVDQRRRSWQTQLAFWQAGISRRQRSIRPTHCEQQDNQSGRIDHMGKECAEGEDLMPVGLEESEDHDRAQGEDREQEEHDETQEDDEEEESRRPRSARDPGQPSRLEQEEREMTHIPFRPWCEACVRGKSKRKPSRRLTGEYAHDQCCRVRMDYAYLTEELEAESGEHGEAESTKAGATLTMLVVQESQRRSV